MTVEQKPELNRLVDSSIPLTWAKRWSALKLTLPLWCFCFVCFCEMALLRAWMADKLTVDFIAVLIAGSVFLFLLVWGIVELQVYFEHRSKRIFEIGDKHIVVKPAKHRFLRWKEISKFQFEPIADAPGLTKLSVFGKFGKIERRRFAMVLETPLRAGEIIRCLESKKAAAQAAFEIKILEQTAPDIPPQKIRYIELSLCMGGIYLLLHGLPLIGVAWRNGHPDPSQSSKMSATARVAWEYFVLRHFSSAEEMRHAFLWTGIILTTMGIALYLSGLKLMKRGRLSAPDQNRPLSHPSIT